jgi:hypothetical protein
LQHALLTYLHFSKQIRLKIGFDLICAAMNRHKKIFSIFHITSSLFMMATLFWLTVSTPFVNDSQQAQRDLAKKSGKSFSDNPFATTTEEKNESNTSSLSEYLHEIPQHDPVVKIIIKDYKVRHFETYIAFHPELVSPPPKA